MEENELVYQIWLNKLDGIGCEYAQRVINHFKTAKNIYDLAAESDFGYLDGFPIRLCREIIENKKLDEALKIAERIQKENISYIFYSDPEYPELLRQIHSPPQLLFYRGQNLFASCRAALAIVGTRKASPYGICAAKGFASRFAESGITVVSGLALGIDAAAHKAALEAKGETIGVMGCGTDYVYPPSHKKLYNDIVENGGMLVTEFLPDTPPVSGNFPRRNRIISGLSLGTFVVEAALSSGSLITAAYALEQNREVYALPSDITSFVGKGTNRLIKDGAKLVTSAEDILEDLFHLLKPLVDSSKNDAEKSEVINGLTAEEKKIYNTVLGGARSAEEIAVKLLMPVNYVNSAITMLELKQLLAVKTGSVYVMF